MKSVILLPVIVFGMSAAAVLAADYRLEPLAEAAPADGVSPAIAKLLSADGVKVIKGKNRTLCDVWFLQTWPAKEGFKPTSSVLYPFEVGQLLGVARFKSKGADFRGQQIPAGVYTIRYAQQPVDGNHVGTSDTRDFLLLLPADADKDAKPFEAKAMAKASAKVAGTKHPTMLALLAASADGGAETALRHDEAHDFWILRVEGKTDGAALPLELVVVGEAKH